MMKRILLLIAAACALVAPAAALSVEEALLDALISKGAPGDGAVAIVGGVPKGLTGDGLEVTSVDYDPTSGRFIAQIKLVTGRIYGMQGRVESGIDMPVLNRDMAAGEQIGPDDIVLTRVPKSRVMRGAVTDSGVIVGMIARRQLNAGTGLRDADLQKPIAVKKGETVTIVYRAPGVELSTRGQAMADGGIGDTIAVTNTQSHRQIQTVITGAGTVSVSPQTVAYN
jgi:flagella basal body P-ring formation protein FlgA